MNLARPLALLAASCAAALAQDASRVDFLLDRLQKADDFKVRVAAAQELGKVADGSVVPWITQAFQKERNAAVRLATLEAVGKIPDAAALSPILDLSTRAPMSAQELLAVERIFWTSRAAIAVPAWEKHYASARTPFEKGVAVWVLGLCGDAKPARTLVDASKSADANVRRQAFRALGLVGGVEQKAYCESAAGPGSPAADHARDCARWIDARARGAVPPAQSPFVATHGESGNLARGAFTPDAFRAYQAARNAPAAPRKPEAWIAAADNLRENVPQERAARSVPIMESQEVLPTLRMSADAMGDFEYYAQDLAVLQAALKDRASDIDRCYLSRLEAKAKLKGDLLIQTRVDGAGKVVGLSYLPGSLTDAALRDCVSGIVRGTRFPKTRFKSVDVKYQFSFLPPKDLRLEF